MCGKKPNGLGTESSLAISTIPLKILGAALYIPDQ